MSNDDEVRIDRALLDRVAARDASAIAALYDRHGRLLFGLILWILCNRSEAEEALQEVFLRAWTRIETYDAPGVRFPPHQHTGDEECYVIRQPDRLRPPARRRRLPPRRGRKRSRRALYRRGLSHAAGRSTQGLPAAGGGLIARCQNL